MLAKTLKLRLLKLAIQDKAEMDCSRKAGKSSGKVLHVEEWCSPHDSPRKSP